MKAPVAHLWRLRIWTMAATTASGVTALAVRLTLTCLHSTSTMGLVLKARAIWPTKCR